MLFIPSALTLFIKSVYTRVPFIAAEIPRLAKPNAPASTWNKFNYYKMLSNVKTVHTTAPVVVATIEKTAQPAADAPNDNIEETTNTAQTTPRMMNILRRFLSLCSSCFTCP